MYLGLKRRKHFCKWRVGRRLHPKPCAQGVAQTGLAQIDLNPVAVTKNRVVASVESDRGHFPETNFAALNIFAAPITSDLMDNAYGFCGFELHQLLISMTTATTPIETIAAQATKKSVMLTPFSASEIQT